MGGLAFETGHDGLEKMLPLLLGYLEAFATAPRVTFGEKIRGGYRHFCSIQDATVTIGDPYQAYVRLTCG